MNACVLLAVSTMHILLMTKRTKRRRVSMKSPASPNMSHLPAHMDQYMGSIAAKAKVELYDDAVKRYKKEVEAVALEKIREELGERIRKEVIAEYEKELKANFEQQWADDKKVVMKKEVQDAMFARMRDGMF